MKYSKQMMFFFLLLILLVGGTGYGAFVGTRYIINLKRQCVQVEIRRAKEDLRLRDLTATLVDVRKDLTDLKSVPMKLPADPGAFKFFVNEVASRDAVKILSSDVSEKAEKGKYLLQASVVGEYTSMHSFLFEASHGSMLASVREAEFNAIPTSPGYVQARLILVSMPDGRE